MFSYLNFKVFGLCGQFPCCQFLYKLISPRKPLDSPRLLLIGTDMHAFVHSLALSISKPRNPHALSSFLCLGLSSFGWYRRNARAPTSRVTSCSDKRRSFWKSFVLPMMAWKLAGLYPGSRDARCPHARYDLHPAEPNQVRYVPSKNWQCKYLWYFMILRFFFLNWNTPCRTPILKLQYYTFFPTVPR